MPDVDAKLATSLRQAKSRPMFFAFVAKGASDGALIVSGKAIPANEIKEAKTKCGGTTVFRGRCFGEEGKTVFETADPPPASLAAQLHKIITRDAGLSLQVETRFGAPPDPTADGAGGEAAPPAPPPPPPAPSGDAAAFKERIKKLLPLVQQAGQKAPDRKAALDQVAAQAVAAAKAGDFAQALNLVGRLEAAAAKILGAAGTAAPPPTAPPTPPTVDAAAFRERFKVVLPQYQQAAQKAPDRKAELDKIAAQAAAAAKAGDFARALQFVEQLAAASAKAVQARASSESESGESESTEGESGKKKSVNDKSEEGESKESESDEGEEDMPRLDAAAFKARLKEVLPLYKKAAEKAPDRKDELGQLATQASKAGQDKDFPKAIDLLDQLEARSRSALRGAEAKEEIETGAGKGNVVFRKWRAEKLSAASALKNLQKALLADTESASTVPDWEVVTREAGRLDEVIEVFHKLDKDLETALDAVLTAAPKERDQPRAAALDVVQKYRQTLKDDPIYPLLDNGAYGPIKIASVISAALDGLADALK